ncbi:FAD-binding protein [Nocardiopsis dassonvillei]|uniref:FAD linked oxidase domain protein n=1 Tax=Nocardiopsis dassonvillei (strain ATCC 23218 / DSM 43111 / CIP 107115 / JCM 7437 / KCTC 9190 / NBRC 14626 / NCTC 10488 / NRRL B-5397 / IMRU 509) TaxID=446468 RepID=D7B060_NOCDD|nr:FAD-binding protein [Nocardiopsis dassonvillei]ADH70148.1 FAD linked oxidase domain protein [Nocardiopsis dassonvillei subsp. dassonvillei DSM 43111]APC38119.1 FAD-binding protein [Nocardiopsis dassonvillei]NKY79362.1 FAD-binding protein [Nocardiopsis dassonvillei]VEI90664.1 Probable xylitol oxidase [Nocardiopsis dassonvillei]
MSAPNARTTNWAGNVTFGSPRVHRPRTLDELRRVVRDSPRIRALGSGHSFNLVADSDADLVRLDGLPAEAEIDPEGRTVTVTAGTRYAELVTALHGRGFALANLASLPHISVAGSCATGTHGSGDGQRCLSAAVRAVQLLGPDGDLGWLSRDADPEVLPGAVVALGALGVVTRLSLEIEPAFTMTQRVRVGVALDEVADHVDDVFGAAYSVSLFTDWLGEGSVWLKQRTDRPEGAWRGGRPASGPVHPVPGMPPEPSTEQMGVVGPWHERLPHFRPELEPSAGRELQSEFYVPREAAGAAFAALRGIGHLLAPALYVAEVRTVRADDLWLSPAHGRDCVTFHFTWLPDPRAVAPVLAAVEERLLPLGARPHWGKLTAMDPADITARYERAADFERLTRALDPGGKFRNAFTDALFPRG